ncbi:MAG: DinB family protein [Gemmatimonadales bacterium]
MRLPLLLAVLAATPLAAQSGNHVAGTVRDVWTPTIGFITTAAEEMPEAKYGFRPVAGVRTFGELIGHVAGAQNMICAAVLGDPQPSEDAVEKSATTKAALVAALKASTAYCAKAYATPDAAIHQEITLWGGKHSKLWALVTNAAHDDEHYGNIVTYLRMNGMVPPSSRGQ